MARMFFMVDSFSNWGSIPAAPAVGDSYTPGEPNDPVWPQDRQTRLDSPRPLCRILLPDKRTRPHNLFACCPLSLSARVAPAGWEVCIEDSAGPPGPRPRLTSLRGRGYNTCRTQCRRT